jgi:hypothetical protein
MIDKALLVLRPGAAWSLNGDTYEGLVWMDTVQSCPSREEINAEVVKLQAEWDSKEYQRKRVLEYPSFAEQFDLLYHGGYEAWKASIDEVKAKYPKGEA